jgi:hypothetical protein
MEIELGYAQDGIVLETGRSITLPIDTSPANLVDSLRADPRARVLQELWSDQLLEVLGAGTFLIPWAASFEIEPAAASVLGLPRPEPVDLEMTSSGIPGGRFSIHVNVRHPQQGMLPPERRRGPAYLLEDGRCVLVPRSVWDLLLEVERAPESASAEAALHYVARCKAAAITAAARMDPFLERQDVSIASKLEAVPMEDGDELEIRASVDGLAPDQILTSTGEPRRVVSTPGSGGKTRRLIVPDEIAEGVRRIRSRQRLRGSEIPQFLTNPEQFLPPGVDLSAFSQRVRGFRTRVYNSRPYLHVRQTERGWLEFDAGVKLESATAEDPEVQSNRPPMSPEEYEALATRARETGERFVRHGDAWVEIDQDTSRQFSDTVRRIRSAKAKGVGAIGTLLLDVIPNVEILEFEISLPEGVGGHRAWHDELPPIAPPSSLKATLDDEQLLGFRWLQYLSEKGIGGLLADEMGVGKTVQVIAHLLTLFEKGALTPSLVVLPKTLIVNWLREIERFAPSLRPVHVHDGPNRTNTPSELQRHPLVITSYDVARRDQALLGIIDWRIVVADEAQFVKNPTASRTSALKALKASQPLALTGTPVENGLLDFWCLMDFVHPGLLKSWSEFRHEYERPLADAKAEEQRAPIVADLLSRLDPHYLRRMKDEVLRSLPKKEIKEDSDIPLSAIQKDLYVETLASAKAGGRGAVLAGIGKLLRVCAHGRLESGDWLELSTDQLVGECPKLFRTLQRIEQIRARGEKVLIFAEWKEMQRILQRVIHGRFGAWADIVNGDVTERRQEVLDAFRKAPGFAAIILSVHVAGFGINLVEANHVIHYTRPWNPAKESQATDRVHRRGQTRDVEIYLPIVAGTVEERLAQLLRDKEQLARDVMRPSSERLVSAEELLDGVELR